MIDLLARNWWALAVRGVAAIVFGVFALLWPGITLRVLVLFFAAYMLVDGIFAVVAGLRAAERHERWWPLVTEGVLDLLVGAVAFLWPGLAIFTFVYLTAFWAILTGVVLLAAGLRFHRAPGQPLLVLSGLVSLLWGVIVVFWPIAGWVAMSWWIGAYALLFGIFMLSFALRLRRRRAAMPGGASWA